MLPPRAGRIGERLGIVPRHCNHAKPLPSDGPAPRAPECMMCYGEDPPFHTTQCGRNYHP